MKDGFSFFSYPEIPKIHIIKEPINNETYMCCKRHAEACLKVFLTKKSEKNKNKERNFCFKVN